MKLTIFFLSLILSCYLNAQKIEQKDTLVLNPITWETPSPLGWNAQYKIKVNFPNENGEVIADSPSDFGQELKLNYHIRNLP